MTLCIALACTHEDEPRIVLCNDWKEQAEGIGSSEHTDKQTWVKDGWAALTAGSNSQIEELLRLYRDHFGGAVLNESNYMEALKLPAQTFKAMLAEDYSQYFLAMPYSHLLQYGKERLPEDFFRDCMSEIARIRIQASLIIAGFLHGSRIGDIESGLFPVICVVEDNDAHATVVREEIHFASIGTGMYTANAALYNRGANCEMPVLAAVYAAYEAHRLSEKVPGVGEDVSIDVLEPGGVLRGLSDDGYKYCEFLWRKFGPKDVTQRHTRLFDMKNEFFEPHPSANQKGSSVPPSTQQ